MMMLMSMHERSQSQCTALQTSCALLHVAMVGQCLLVNSKSQEMLYRKDHHPVVGVCVPRVAGLSMVQSTQWSSLPSSSLQGGLVCSSGVLGVLPPKPRCCEDVKGVSCCSVSSGSQGQSAWPCHLLDLSHALLAGGLLALASLHSLLDCSLSVLLSDLSASTPGGLCSGGPAGTLEQHALLTRANNT